MAKDKTPDGGGTGGGPGGGNSGGGQGNDKLELTIVVAGESVDFKAKPDETLLELAEKALKKTKNSGQPIDNWELRDEGGTLLDLNRAVGSYAFANGVLLSLTLKAGIAG